MPSVLSNKPLLPIPQGKSEPRGRSTADLPHPNAAIVKKTHRDWWSEPSKVAAGAAKRPASSWPGPATNSGFGIAGRFGGHVSTADIAVFPRLAGMLRQLQLRRFL